MNIPSPTAQYLQIVVFMTNSPLTLNYRLAVDGGAPAARYSFVKPFRPFFTVKLPSLRAVTLIWLPPSSLVKFAMKLSADWTSFATNSEK